MTVGGSAAYNWAMSAGPHLDDPGVAERQSASTNVVMSLTAVGAALIAMFGEADAFTPLTVVAALVGLVPWALLAGGVTIRPAIFAVVAYRLAKIRQLES